MPTINHPDNSRYLSISTNGCHPQLFLFVVPDYYSQPFWLVLVNHICCWDLILLILPKCFSWHMTTDMSIHPQGSRSNTLPYKTLCNSNVVAPIQFFVFITLLFKLIYLLKLLIYSLIIKDRINPLWSSSTSPHNIVLTVIIKVLPPFQCI